MGRKTENLISKRQFAGASHSIFFSAHAATSTGERRYLNTSGSNRQIKSFGSFKRTAFLPLTYTQTTSYGHTYRQKRKPYKVCYRLKEPADGKWPYMFLLPYSYGSPQLPKEEYCLHRGTSRILLYKISQSHILIPCKRTD